MVSGNSLICISANRRRYVHVRSLKHGTDVSRALSWSPFFFI
jgi:hypothetical protein